MNTNQRRKTERGAALLLVMFAIILVSGMGVLMYFSSGTESRIDANYGGNLNAYYAARFGVEEVRDRVKYSAFANPAIGGMAELLPNDIAGNPNGVLYVLNPANGENVDPTNINNRYFDDQLCHDYNSGVPRGAKCTTTPVIGNWNLPPLTSLAGAGTALPYKWVRVNMKTNRISEPYFVDATNLPTSLDTRVCWDGVTEQLSPGGANPACDANGMRTVYMLTSLAVTPGVAQTASRRFLRSEMVAPSIRPPGAITMDAVSAGTPVLSDGGIPTTAIDGRVHKIDGTLATTNRCSTVAAVSTDNPQTSTQMAQALSNLRASIVQTANSSCNADGTTMGSSATACTPGLWWVRGTASATRFTTTTSTSGSSGGSGSSDGGHDHSGTSGGPGPSPTPSTTGFIANGITTSCDPSTSSCYSNLDLTAPQLMAQSASLVNGVLVMGPSAGSPFVGAPGNSLDPAIYQTSLANTLPNEVKTLSALVTLSAGQANYIESSAANLAPSYGTASQPAIVVITPDSSFTLQRPLTGFGVLVVPNDFEIASNLQWTGVVLVRGGAAQFAVRSGATGFINGSLMLQPSAGTAAVIQTSTSRNSAFLITYSCDAIDLAFNSLPYKIIASSESSF